MRPYADPPGTHAPLGGAHAPLGGTAGVEACKTVIGGLGIDLDGATVFCPSNAAWLAFAEALGYKGHDPVLKMAFNMPIGALKAVVSYHIVPDAVLPASTFAALRGASLRTRAGAALTARRDPDGVVSLLAGGAAGAAEAGVTARDWTLGGGSYGPESRHVVHEVDAVLAPPGLQAELEAVRARNTAGSRRLRF
ncbi:MAG: hypothetical protein J3K34DRAFT_423161 [Monoraphidium minutum]|nr:MAG: hypothetical protein J3K34DRAFT_423161 [Monoraphidium minutum]